MPWTLDIPSWLLDIQAVGPDGISNIQQGAPNREVRHSHALDLGNSLLAVGYSKFAIHRCAGSRGDEQKAAGVQPTGGDATRPSPGKRPEGLVRREYPMSNKELRIVKLGIHEPPIPGRDQSRSPPVPRFPGCACFMLAAAAGTGSGADHDRSQSPRRD